ncbi:MAG: hypothetical protein JWP28_3153 [Phenylobacterium sp.]|uniref:hypothetical protein n=1 Tax=Phenylobacterium sp. TaxID=1871053 RepID=UPI002639725A|nr:hypothetical protein [Phenylobacterium sp.]MDB5499122.1 hypothetical protein [Phenylobacterium sp.]
MFGLIVAAAQLAVALPSYSRELPATLVGCASDGQLGPQHAPRSVRVPSIPAPLASKVAYYASAEGPGVLAPRGWHCFGLYGSSGTTLLVTPELHSSEQFFADQRFKTPGPAVEVSYEYGGTSGRWSVAHAIARYFPDQRGFIGDENFKGLDVGPLPTGPYPGDVMGSRTSHLVRFVTPPHVAGMGTAGLLSPGDDPVDGLVVLVPTADGPNLLTLNARLPRSLEELRPLIIRKARFNVPG